jgi:hypothetical protein
MKRTFFTSSRVIKYMRALLASGILCTVGLVLTGCGSLGKMSASERERRCVSHIEDGPSAYDICRDGYVSHYRKPASQTAER